MTPSKPYIMRALYEWIIDNERTPYMVVATEFPGVSVPDGFAENGQMVLNLSPSAVRHFTMNNEVVCFEARFSGVPHQIVVPVYAALAIYAQENGQGMYFEAELPAEYDDASLPETEDNPQEPPEPPKNSGRPSLRVVK